MNKEEIKEYLKRVEELELKLTGEDKDTLQWLIFGYNECARLLNQLETNRDEVIETIDKMIHTGYQDGLNYYWATKTQSEFGIRGKIIKQILERGKE